jgi:PEP-CTERM motif
MKKNNMPGRVFLAVLTIAGCAAPMANAQNYLNTFDSSTAPGRFDYEGSIVTPTITLASGPIFDAGGSASSGSAKLSWIWDGVNSGSAAFTFDTTFPEQDFSFGTLSFDLRLDSSSTPGSFADYGYFQVAARNTSNYNFQDLGIGGGLITQVSAPDVWTHISISLNANANELRAITFQDYNDVPGRSIMGSVTYYIDNLSIMAAVPEPSTVTLAGFGIAGLFAGRRSRKARN